MTEITPEFDLTIKALGIRSERSGSRYTVSSTEVATLDQLHAWISTGRSIKAFAHHVHTVNTDS